MTDDVAVVMAYRDLGVPERRRSFEFVHTWYADRGWRVVVEAGEDDATFTRAKAINAGIRRTTADVIVQADPDNLVSSLALHAAVGLAEAGHRGLIFPHDRYLRLSRDATEAVLTGRRDVTEMGPEDCDPDEGHGANASGGVVVFTRATWETVGGFDERFGIVSGDDAAWRYAVEAYYGPSRRLVEQFAILAEWRDASAEGAAAVRQMVDRLRSRAAQ